MSMRPYVSRDIEFLEDTFESNKGNINMMFCLKYELEHRNTRRAKELEIHVDYNIQYLRNQPMNYDHQQVSLLSSTLQENKKLKEEKNSLNQIINTLFYKNHTLTQELDSLYKKFKNIQDKLNQFLNK